MNEPTRSALTSTALTLSLVAALASCAPVYFAGEEPPIAAPGATTIAVPAPAVTVPAPAKAPRRPELRPFSGCGFDQRGPAQGLFVAVSDKDLVLTSSDGSARVIHSFAAGQTVRPDSFWVGRLLASDGLIFAMAGWSTGEATSASELVLLDRGGGLIWRKALPHTGFWEAFLGPGGVAISGSLNGLMVTPQGSERELTGMSPLGAPLADGTLRVTIDHGAYVLGTPAFLAPGATTAAPLTFTSLNGLPHPVGERLVYLAEIGGEEFLVSEGAGGDVRKAQLPSKQVWLRYVEPGAPFAILFDYSKERAVYRVDLNTLAVAKVEESFPAGLHRFNVGGYFGTTVGSDGALLVGLRDDYVGRLYRSTDLGKSWLPVGGSTVNVLDIVGVSRSGTILMHGTNNRYSYEAWKASPDGSKADVVGTALQVVRPDAPKTFVLPETRYYELPGAAALSDDGLCLGYWRPSAEGSTVPATLELLDIEKGVTRTVYRGLSRQWESDDVAWLSR